jgi:hypothetical protein
VIALLGRPEFAGSPVLTRSRGRANPSSTLVAHRSQARFRRRKNVGLKIKLALGRNQKPTATRNAFGARLVTMAVPLGGATKKFVEPIMSADM